jgi:uncharacterized protein (TIGR00730 family)
MSKSKKRNNHNSLKAYDNKKFIHSRDGRTIRILAEYLYPLRTFKNLGIQRMVIFFGSARVKPLDYLENEISRLKSSLEIINQEEINHVTQRINKLESLKTLSKYYDEAVELAEMLTKWSISLPKRFRFCIGTGGGPGLMEAANKGAFLAGGKSAGLNISLPFEQHTNHFLTPELNLEFHYFFMRKFWFVYLAQALVVFPGGFGTLDELMEILTLTQTKKVKKPLPILLYGEEYWRNIINFNYMADLELIKEDDLKLFRFANSPNEAFEYLQSELLKIFNL